MKTKIQKWGNSFGVRLPKHIMEQTSLQEGAGVYVMVKNDQIVLEPIQDEISLDFLLTKITQDNSHGETEWSSVRGKEIW